jgi:hypothetical protein
MYRVFLERAAEKQLKQLSAKVHKRVIAALVFSKHQGLLTRNFVMAKLFSKRYGFAQRRQREPIIEAAPDFLRIPFIKNILADRTYRGYGITRLRRPLQVSELSETLYVLFQKERGRLGDYGFAEDLKPLLMDCGCVPTLRLCRLMGGGGPAPHAGGPRGTPLSAPPEFATKSRGLRPKIGA